MRGIYRAPSLCQALWRVTSHGQHPPSRAQSLRRCLEKGKCRCPAHKSMKQDRLKHNQGVQLGGPLPRKEVEYLRCQGGPSGVSRSVLSTPTFEAGHRPLKYLTQESWWGAHPSHYYHWLLLMPRCPLHPTHPTSASTPPCTPPLPQQNNTSKEFWGVDADAFSSPASAGPVLGAARPLSQEPPASLKGGDCHPHFTEEETKAEVEPRTKP